jgi:hypothetical protein
MPRAEALLWPRGKTEFIRPDGSIGRSPGHGIVLVGMGERGHRCDAALWAGGCFGIGATTPGSRTSRTRVSLLTCASGPGCRPTASAVAVLGIRGGGLWQRHTADAVARMTATGKGKADPSAPLSLQPGQGHPAARQADQRPLDATWQCLRDASVVLPTPPVPARFLAIQLGTDAETVIRWLVALLVMRIDPSPVVLTIAASRRN